MYAQRLFYLLTNIFIIQNVVNIIMIYIFREIKINMQKYQ